MLEFEFIVIGAGSAGCVLAHRLSEDPGHRVLVLEAGGPDDHPFLRVPLAYSTLFGTAYDWAYQTAAQVHLHGRQIPWPRGKVLGGSSSINAMIYQRGHRHYYDHWAALGNEGWSYDEVLPFFKKAQHQTRGESRYHGTHGPQQVTDLAEAHPLSLAFVEAAIESGFGANEDFNGEQQEGFGLFQVNQKQQRRHSSAEAYLRPALSRDQVEGYTHAQATRLRFEGRRCVGVEYLHHGQLQRARVTREVLLCGGAINSPQLLMLSGLGAPAQLARWEIPVVAELPGVGQGLQDHLALPVSYRALNIPTVDDLRVWHRRIWPLLEYFLFKRGIGASNGAEAGGFVKLSQQAPAPELQFHFTPAFGMVPDPAELPEGRGFTLSPTLAHVESRGELQLQSADPLKPPRIDPQYLSAPEDLAVLVEGIRHARSIAGAEAFSPYRGEELFPGAGCQSLQQLEDFVRRRATTLFHPVGTCKMGLEADAMAVVDPRLRVHGVEGLRVVDASIMPTLINANTHTPTTMIAERAAAWILEG